jgi:energy-coupling factor transporter ATP-binding protein EcfA2
MEDLDGSVETIIIDRLGNSGLAAPAADLIVAALLGDDEVTRATSGADSDGAESGGAGLTWAAPPRPEPPRVYLRGISVAGFRGIGRTASLELRAGPGLTLVIGRNGSGKSSFAEAAELALTGENKRWSMPGRGVVWRNGWRNLHASDGARIAVDLAADGRPGVISVVREWPDGGGLADAVVYAQAPGTAREPFATLNWSAPLELYRPFLSYSELGALVSGKPTEMHDAVQAILGLDQLIDAERRLADARKHAEADSKRAAQALPDLLGRLREHPDERARTAMAALERGDWDLATITTLASGGDEGRDELADGLRQVAAFSLPSAESVTEAARRLGSAVDGVAALSGTPAADARRLAGLLTTALGHYGEHRGESCPVCGGRVLDAAWAETARADASRLTELARDADAAHAELDAASRALRNLVPPQPAVLSTGLPTGVSADLGPEVDLVGARAAWQGWADLVSTAAPRELADGADGSFAALTQAVAGARTQAAQALRRRSEDWRPIALALGGWAESARASERAAITLRHLRKAISWLRDTGKEVRNERLAPFAELSARVWEMLRQESNVELGPIRLEGSANLRRVSLDVTVDGVPGAALGVMSQGELHALGLALFLPRATASASPFRFLVIDDPVQSMDPAKVDGLARLLHQVATDRQVIVFTHDDRLPEALRRLGLPATIWEVARREQSLVELKKADDPVARYLDDARAVARSKELPEDARAVVVAGFCRSALEAACHEVIRTRRIGAGRGHAEVERVLGEAHTLHDVVALALFDDTRRGDRVVSKLRELAGQSGVNAFWAAKTGVHDAYQGDLRPLVQDTARLTEALMARPT